VFVVGALNCLITHIAVDMGILFIFFSLSTSLQVLSLFLIKLNFERSFKKAKEGIFLLLLLD
jgi:hypothetical protein